MKKKGFFGGTFDPIHFGHIHLALSLLEAHQLDEVVFCPAFISPHKVKTPPTASPEERLKMTELAIAPIPQFSLSSREIDRGGISFTIDTIREWVANDLQSKHFLLLSEKVLSDLPRWKDVDELLKLSPPLVGGHTNKRGLTCIPQMEISSTMLRQRLKKRLYCGHLMPRVVLDFIYDNKLFLK